MQGLEQNSPELHRAPLGGLLSVTGGEQHLEPGPQKLRNLIDEVRLVPEDDHLEIELAGDLAGILALAAGNKKPVTEGRDGLQVTLVAGRGFEPLTFRL